MFLTFILCFILVAAIKLIYAGILSLKKQPPKEEEKPTPPKAEPVYYIVEKKKTRKPKYSEPKEIKFKD